MPRCPQCDADASNDSIIMHSGVNEKREGFIHLASGTGLRAQLTPAETRTHALRLLECAEAAESDAMVLRLLVDKVGTTQNQALQIVAELRNFRDERYVKKPDAK